MLGAATPPRSRPQPTPPRPAGQAGSTGAGTPLTISGVARLGRRTKALTPTLAPGAVVFLDHADLDSVAARALAARRPAAVVNDKPFVTGRYPNRGPSILLEAGIPLFDVRHAEEEEGAAAVSLFDRLADGEPVTIDGAAGVLRRGGEEVAALRPLTHERLGELLAAARENLDAELSSFAQNTLRYLDRAEERALLLDPVDVPEVSARIAGRPVLVVVRGDGYEEDLEQLAPYIREQEPVLIAVDGAADALLARGLRPHVILGDMDSVSDAALRCGAELIVHAYARPRGGDGSPPAAPGLARTEALGLPAQTFPVAGTSEDAALLLAYEKGADLIVAVGTHTHLEDFLDKGRGGMASTFLVRLKVGSRLVDARGVSRLYTGRQRSGPLFAVLVLAALFPVLVLLASTPAGQVAWRSLVVWFRLLFR
jgi:uncharacterized membrane-anchored protein